jgi:hypothetical protein
MVELLKILKQLGVYMQYMQHLYIRFRYFI